LGKTGPQALKGFFRRRAGCSRLNDGGFGL
jgi:hypothetical protein